jgi:hypothetical protein
MEDLDGRLRGGHDELGVNRHLIMRTCKRLTPFKLITLYLFV